MVRTSDVSWAPQALDCPVLRLNIYAYNVI